MLDVGQPRRWSPERRHMKHRLLRLIVSSALMLGAFVSHVSAARDVEVMPNLTVVGTLVAKSSPFLAPCGVLFPHQLGLYRIDRAYGGELTGLYLVIDHPTCVKDVLADVAVSDRIRVSVDVIENYPDVYLHPGIRELWDIPARFYVAQELPTVVSRGWHPEYVSPGLSN